MIINFSVKNWMSFRDEVSFSMVASKERQHRNRVPRIDKYKSSILPISAIYGGNASGKTNLFFAFHFMKELIVRGTRPESLIPVDSYLLDDNSFDLPSFFKIDLLIDEVIYEYSFSLNRKEVLEEKLVELTNYSEKVLYDRKGDKIEFHSSIGEVDILKFVFRGTRDNQLFLTNSVSQKVEKFEFVYKWFRDHLKLIGPDSRFGPFEKFFDKNHFLYGMMNEMLRELDTGIYSLGEDEVPFNNIPFPEDIKRKLRERVKEGQSVRLEEIITADRFIVTRENGELQAKKLVSFHKKDNEGKIRFDISQESDGSKRVIDLLPAFFDIFNPSSKEVYIIDEVDRSLHSLLIRQLIEIYLEICNEESRSQLLLTTHDLFLMDQNLLRRDEMWITERRGGCSSLIAFSNYKDIRYDKDIRRSYLQGRMGGVPDIFYDSSLMAERVLYAFKEKDR